METKQKTVVIGAGPVGALAAIYAAQRGHNVEIYELRSDLRDPSTTPLNFTRSINLALSERGINAMSSTGRPDLIKSVMAETIPMRGRMIHGKDAAGDFYEQSQDYDVLGRTIFAVDRGGLNKRLLDELESMPNVKFFFSHKMVGADFRKNLAWFDKRSSSASLPVETEVSFDFLIGADGAHSAARYHMMKFTRMDYQQEYIDTLWCEFQIQPNETYDIKNPYSQFRISPNHLHIWPGKEYMFIAIPSLDGSFTCTLFLPANLFATLESSPSSLPTFFDIHFPGVTALISPSTLISSFTSNPHLPLISIKCTPHHFSSSGVILGDAAHAMVPFYGQGMNAGLEDVRVLFSVLDAHLPPSTPSSAAAPLRARALAEYSATRTPDAHAINDLALQNYIEMRAGVISPLYRVRKALEEALSVWVPALGWQTKYSRVSFGNEGYADVVRRSEMQGRVLGRLAMGVGGVFGVVLWRLLAGGRGRWFWVWGGNMWRGWRT